MSAERPGPSQSVPTLTEVVSLPETGRAAPVGAAQPAPQQPDPVPQTGLATPPIVPDESGAPASHEAGRPDAAFQSAAPVMEVLPGDAQLTRQVLEELQRQIDGVLEYRVREVLAPILARATDAVVREARNEISRSVRDLVAQLLAQELQRQRGR